MKNQQITRCLAGLMLLLALFWIALPQKAFADRTAGAEEEEEEEEAFTIEQQRENQKQVTVFLREEMALNNAAVAAILANVDRESSFDHLRTAPGQYSFGLFQWNKMRWADFQEYCQENDLDEFSLEAQLIYFQVEMESKYPDLLTYVLQGCENSREGALRAQYYFCLNYEVPADMEGEQELRAELVQDAYWPLLTEGRLTRERIAAEETEDPEELSPEGGEETAASRASGKLRVAEV